MNPIPAIGISVSEQVGQRSIVLQTHVAGDCTPSELDAQLDRLLRAADRQKLFYETKEELFKLRLNLDHHETQLEQMLKDMATTEKVTRERWNATGRKGEYKLTASEAAAKDNALRNVESFTFNIDRLKTAIAEHEGMLTKIGKE